MSVATLARSALLLATTACSAVVTVPAPVPSSLVARVDELLLADEPPAVSVAAPIPPASDPLGGESLALLQLQRLSNGAEALTSGRPAEAAELLDALLGDDPDHGTARYLRGIARMQLGRDDEALVDLERAIELAPDDPGPYGLVARLRSDRGELGLAIDAMERSIALGFDEAWSYATLGHLQLDDGRWIAAYETLKTAVDLDPTCVPAHRGLASLFSTIGDAERAAQAFRVVLSSEPEEVGALVGLGHVLRDLGDADAALPLYEQARDLEPDRGVHRANIAATLFELGRYREAIDVYEASLDAPDGGGVVPAIVHASIGSLHERLGDLNAAIDEYEWALELDPTLGMAHESLGVLAHDRGDARRAEKHLATALHLGVLAPASLVVLAELRELDGDGAGVRDVASMLAEIEPRTAEVDYSLASLRVRSEIAGVRDAEAGEALLWPHLGEDLSGSGSAWNLMAEALAAQGRFGEAVAAIEKALAVIETAGPRHRDYARRRDRYRAEIVAQR